MTRMRFRLVVACSAHHSVRASPSAGPRCDAPCAYECLAQALAIFEEIKSPYPEGLAALEERRRYEDGTKP